MMRGLNLFSKILFNILVIVVGLMTLFVSVLGDSNILIAQLGEIIGKDQQILENAGNNYFESDYASIKELKAANKDICLAVESEGAVLLKNEMVDGKPALPVSKGSTISMFSVTSVNPYYSGSGAAGIRVSDEDRISFKQVLEDVGFTVNEGLWNWYMSNTQYWRARKEGDVTASWQKGNSNIADASWDEITTDAKTQKANVAMFVLGRYGLEGYDLPKNGPGDRYPSDVTVDYKNGNYLELNDKEISVLENLKKEKDKGTFDKIVVVINAANPIQSEYINDPKYGIDSVLWIGYPGTSGLYAVGDILSGAVTPSGRLSEAWWEQHCLNPVLTNAGNFTYQGFPSSGYDKRNAQYVVYQEGIYVGYRYAETRYEDAVMGTANTGDFDYSKTITYPFGYGLSYTTFEYSDYSVEYNAKTDKYICKVKVTNVGDMAGKEVVQIYLQQPYTSYDIDNHIEKSAVDLVGFAKTKKLAKGESEVVIIEVDGEYLASYDAYGYKTWFVDAGKYYLTAAKNSHDAVNNILAAKGYNKSNNEVMDTNGNTSLVYSFEKEADYTTYSKSTNTGYAVTNLFDNADLNISDSENTIQYITRNNWEGTVKLAFDDNHVYTDRHELVKWSAAIASGYALDSNKSIGRDNVAFPNYDTYTDDYFDENGNRLTNEDGTLKRMQLIELRQNPETGEMIPYDDPKWDILLDQLTREETEAILCDGFRRTKGLAAIGKPETVDHNGGCGFSQKFTIGGEASLAVKNKDEDMGQYPVGYPCCNIIASTFNVDAAYLCGTAIGEDSLWSGCPGIYGIGLNIHRNPYHGRYFEYYSEDAFLTGIITGAESAGIWSKGCYVYNKHFVLNEQETNRDQVATYLNEQTMRQNYLRAFMLAIREGDAMCVMTAFNRIGSVWSGNHEGLMTEWLRNEAGMRGHAVTDWFTPWYMGLASGVLAGNDIPDGVANNVFIDYREGEAKQNGELAWAMRESVHRVLYTVVHSNAMNGIGEGTRVVIVPAQWKTTVKDIHVGICVAFGASAVLLVVTGILKKRFY
jgi:beta-glucosidase